MRILPFTIYLSEGRYQDYRKKIKWEHILLFFLELLVNMATVGVAILLNALIDAAVSITSQDAHHLQKVLFISILYAVCLGVLVFLSNRYKACYIRKRLLENAYCISRWYFANQEYC